MRYCGRTQRLCDRLVFSQAVTFANGTLTVNLPDGSYGNGCNYCIVIAQTIPATTTISAPVIITIGDGTTEYPVVNRCCAQITACALRTRTKYPVVVATSAAGGTFKITDRVSCAPSNVLTALSSDAPAEGGGV